ncbi:membrane-bound lytic murein transglycosylase B [Bordetella pertussis]|nr:membrane-bound lytic murein transglycosylase B [Bordetella pertussis]
MGIVDLVEEARGTVQYRTATPGRRARPALRQLKTPVDR